MQFYEQILATKFPIDTSFPGMPMAMLPHAEPGVGVLCRVPWAGSPRSNDWAVRTAPALLTGVAACSPARHDHAPNSARAARAVETRSAA